MKKNILKIAITLLFSNMVYSQVGINTQDPKATFDIVGNPADKDIPDGVIAPKLTGSQLKAKDNSYGTDQTGAIVYISEALNSTDTTTKTTNVTAVGYYFFDGNKWVMLRSKFKSNIYTANGSLKGNRTVSLNDHNLGFSGDGNVGIGGVNSLAKLNVEGFIQFAPDTDYGTGKIFDDTTGEKYGITKSVVFPSSGAGSSSGTRIYTSGSSGVPGHISFGKYTNENTYTEWGRFGHITGNFGLGTTDPIASLDIEGSMRLSPNPADNTPNELSRVYSMYINQSDGSVAYAPKGFTTAVGGYRPIPNNPKNYSIAIFPINNTIATVRFVCYVDESNDTNNNDGQAYNYGEFTIIGMGTSNPIKIVGFKLKNYQGQNKSFTINSTQNNVSWDNYTQNTLSLNINQSTGEFTINGSNANVFSCFFEILGGI